MSDNQTENQENYRWEYREVAASHRFYVGLRFIIAAFTATLQSALLKLYSDALLAERVPDVLLGGYRFILGSHPLSISLAGLFAIVAIFFMEMRNIDRFGIMVKRGKELEFTLSVLGGQFARLSESKGFWFITYTWSLGGIYFIIAALWSWLVFFNIVDLYQRNF